MLRFDEKMYSIIPYLSHVLGVMCIAGNEVVGHEFSLNVGYVMDEFSYNVYELMLHIMTK